jgi:tripeptide aminopeptidase
VREALAGSEHLVQNAVNAAKQAGVKPKVAPIRGGTDGAILSFRGLPCPNLGTGGWCFHGPLEHVTKEGMEKAADILENLAALYA